jgi:deoxyribose-phosphate aldolase
VERRVRVVGYRDQVVAAECLAASVAVELVAARAEHLAAGGIRTRADFEECVAAIFVVLDRKALEKRVAGWAGGGGELLYHVTSIA